MRNILIIFIVTLLISSVATSLIFSLVGKKSEVLSFDIEATPVPTLLQISTNAPSPIPTPTPLPTSLPTSIPLPTKVPTPTSIPQPQYTSEQIHGFIERFSTQYKVDANIMRHIAVCESGFNPNAGNGPYAGLYQFSVTSWAANRVLMGEDPNSVLRFNAEEAVQTAAFMVSIGKGWVWPNCFP